MRNALFGLTLLLGLGGCALAPGHEEQGDTSVENVGETTSALSTATCGTPPPGGNAYSACWQDTDSTGTISIKIYRCAWTNPSGGPSGTGCNVESDRVLVGGGAQIEHTSEVLAGGGLLWGSFPASKSGWAAFSRDHTFPSPHRLRAWAVGMKLAGVSQSTLANALTISQVTSASGTAPATGVAIPAGHVLLSGGGLANNALQLLVFSYPAGGIGWVAGSKQHLAAPAVGTVTAYAMSMPATIGGFAYSSTWDFATSDTGTGYRNITVPNPTDSEVVTGFGGNAVYTGAGRLLTDLYPRTNGFGGAVATSKDHGTADSGSTTAYAIRLKRL